MAKQPAVVVDFNTLSQQEKVKVIYGILHGINGEWGSECFAAHSIGDSKLYSVPQIMDWVNQTGLGLDVTDK